MQYSTTRSYCPYECVNVFCDNVRKKNTRKILILISNLTCSWNDRMSYLHHMSSFRNPGAVKHVNNYELRFTYNYLDNFAHSVILHRHGDNFVYILKPCGASLFEVTGSKELQSFTLVADEHLKCCRLLYANDIITASYAGLNRATLECGLPTAIVKSVLWLKDMCC